ncbi:MAG: electron transfer flavoprotein subunit beta/FixA family protein [Gemmatimonadetes bacterium]|nr:electron transfer flavoprotein subunit beta/FixA family protein [Gemmatimonadota bacterium]
MKIVTCIKRVPDTEARLKIAAGRDIDAAGLKFIISPYDEFAVEAALQLREAKGGGEVIVVSVGEAAAAEQLRAALALGADRAVLLEAPPTLDGLVTARALAAELKDANADLYLFGMKAADDDQQQVGPMVAELLGLPCVTVVAELELGDGKILCHREVEGGIEVVEAPLPAVVTITKGKYEPRYPSLKGIMAAKKKPLEEKEAAAGPSRVRLLDLSHPPERPPGKVVGQGADAVPELLRLLREEAKAL